MLQRLVRLASAVIGVLAFASPSASEDRGFRLTVDQELQETGLLDYVLPRFSLKTGIRVTTSAHPAKALTTPDVMEEMGAMIADALSVPEISPAARAWPAFRVLEDDSGSAAVYWIVLSGRSGNDSAEVFADWLLSEIGQNTISAFKADGKSLFASVEAETAAQPIEFPEGDTAAGEKLALSHCGRCHVVNHKNRMGGIGSTPSFAALKSIPDWQDRFLTFWSLNPHPSFTQVEGLTEPFDPNRPPHIFPVRITLDEMDAILAFTATIEPKNLGAGVELR